jgi:hypothetical protein
MSKKRDQSKKGRQCDKINVFACVWSGRLMIDNAKFICMYLVSEITRLKIMRLGRF